MIETMLKKLIWFSVALFACCAARAQQAGQPLRKETFVYAVKDADTLRLDRYAVEAFGAELRPCLLFVFGGGFVSGTRDNERYLPYFEYYARRGFVVVSLDYRLGMRRAIEAGTLDESTFPGAFMQTLAWAVEDLYDATSYVVSRAAQWGIDPARIVASGSSAGAITVLMGEYGICNRQALAQNLPKDFNYAGVISFAGAIFDTQEDLRWARTPAPMLLFHGDADRNVVYDVLRYEGAGFFGSKYIAENLTAHRVPHYFYSATNTDHVMATQPMFDNRYEIDSFLEKLVFGREALIVDTCVTPLDAPEVPDKSFGIEDYIQANFGR